MRTLNYILSALTTGLIVMMIILWMPWLVAGALGLMALVVLAALVAWFWFGRRLRKMVKEVEKEMQSQMQNSAAAGNSQRLSSEPDFGNSAPYRQDPFQREQGPVIHIQPEEVPRKD